MRIVAGSRKGAKLLSPKSETRPTGDRVREAAFNLIGPVDGASVLDLFAGSGALGLEALVETTDGFELAEVDLDLRGGGALLGTRQSGLSDLRFAHLLRDRDLLERARAAVPDVGPGPLQDAASERFAEVEPEALA